MQRSSQSILAIGVATLIGLGSFQGRALGQYQVDTGNALDANPGVNSGGFNSRIGPVDINRQNAVITGNVSGLGFFRDDVGYFAPSEFQDSLGSADLFRFRASSLPPSFQGAAAANPGSALNTPLYRLYTPTADQFSGQLSPNAFQANRIEGGFGVVNPMAYTSALSLPKSSLEGDSLFGYFAPVPGQVLEVRASPLFGLRSRDTRMIGLSESLRNLPRPTEGMVPPTTPTPGDLLTDPVVDPPVLPEGEGNLLDSIRGGQGLNPALRDGPPGWQPGAEIGMLLGSPVAPQSPYGQPMALGDRTAAIQQRLFSPLDRYDVRPGQDVYLDLLTRMRERRRADDVLPPPPEDDLGPLGNTADPSPAAPGTGAVPDPLRPLLASPTAEQLADAEARRQEALARLAELASPQNLLPESLRTPPGDAEEQAEYAGQVPVWRMGPMGELMKQLDHDLPPIESLAGNRDDRISGLLREAEGRMATGDFFAAERSYRRVLAAIPGHPMARVGLVHSQIGSGLIRSAAQSMRALFEQHPELIATRYGREILPSVERLQWVRGELDQMIRTTNRAEPALLLAYIGYQMNQPDLVRYGLDLAQAREPGDVLIPLLRGIWLDEGRQAPAPTPEK